MRAERAHASLIPYSKIDHRAHGMFYVQEVMLDRTTAANCRREFGGPMLWRFRSLLKGHRARWLSLTVFGAEWPDKWPCPMRRSDDWPLRCWPVLLPPRKWSSVELEQHSVDDGSADVAFEPPRGETTGDERSIDMNVYLWQSKEPAEWSGPHSSGGQQVIASSLPAKICVNGQHGHPVFFGFFFSSSSL